MAAIPSILLFALMNNMKSADIPSEDLVPGGATEPSHLGVVRPRTGYGGSPLNDQHLASIFERADLRDILNDRTLAQLRVSEEDFQTCHMHGVYVFFKLFLREVICCLPHAFMNTYMCMVW